MAASGCSPIGRFDDDAERAVFVVPYHQDDGSIEAWVAHRRRSDQELTGERNGCRRLGGGRERRDKECKHENCRES